MSRLQFDTFFQAATEKPSPYDYQRRLACGERNDRPEAEWLASGTECNSRLINIPTGLGKTAAVVLAWLWNRFQIRNPKSEIRNDEWPRRLVYCLPMRTLVEQTRDNVFEWLVRLAHAAAPDDETVASGRAQLPPEAQERLRRDDNELRQRTGELAPAKSDLLWLVKHSPVILMGGEEADREWDLHPERPAILIGTQDMLLSRALNRGYGAGRARWPKDFALLNNDCLWVFDEIQLMGSGFATGLQLQGWREELALRPRAGAMSEICRQPVAAHSHSWWMSATVADEWFDTGVELPDHLRDKLRQAARGECERFWKEDQPSDARLAVLLGSGDSANSKLLKRDPVAELKGAKEKAPQYLDDLRRAVLKELNERQDRSVLVILNTVDRAVGLNDLLKDATPLLLHSRFRRRERNALSQILRDERRRPRLIIATQVVEAGVDLSADVLFTELCPWPSFIQRLGRCARGVKLVDGKPRPKSAEVFWMDATKSPLPYSEEELAQAKDSLGNLPLASSGFHQANLRALHQHADGLSPEDRRKLLPYEPRFVPRAKDIVELFDTTPDLTGADVDISRFVRDGDELDVQVFWRRSADLSEDNQPPKKLRPEADELCPVPFLRFRDFAKSNRAGHIWRWDYREGWMRLASSDGDRIYPGQVFLLEDTCGGYNQDTGWTGNPDHRPSDYGPWKRDDNKAETEDPDASDDAETLSEAEWQSILEHSGRVVTKLEETLDAPGLAAALPGEIRRVLVLAARLHDWGKAHPAFESKIHPDALAKAPIKLQGQPPAKAPDTCWRRGRLPKQPADDHDRRRPGFRHELASALALLEFLRLAAPAHDALAWPDDPDLREAFGWTPPSIDVPPQFSSHPLTAELQALSAEQFDLLLYLIAAHHGKVRMSLRGSSDDARTAVPDPCPEDAQQIRGVRDRELLPPAPDRAVLLPGPASATPMSMPAVTLRLDAAALGLSHPYGRSWRERTQALLETHGPFRLAWHETLLRIADSRASMPSPAAFSSATTSADSPAPAVTYPPPQEQPADFALRETAGVSASAYLQSHQYLDDLALAYFRAIAEKIRQDPSLLRIPLENIQRWRRQGSISPGSERGIQVWERLIEQGDLDALIALMTDPGEDGARWRQYPVFVGILTPEESAAIRQEHEANTSAQTA